MSTILVADDDQLLRLILRERLERAGHTVLECGDGMAALQLATEERPDCLVLDVMMPLARGLEVVRQVRRTGDDWAPPIVMVSARTRVSDRLNALEAGADAYIEKPVAPDELADTVARLLDDRVEATPLVDVLGPVWAAAAMEHLTRAALARRRLPSGREALEALFARMLDAGLRPAPTAATGPLPLRVMWETALRSLVGDAAEPPVAPPGPAPAPPVRVPDVAALLAPPATGPDRTAVAFWSGTLGRALRPGSAPGPERITDGVTRVLRTVLGDGAAPAPVVDWSRVLRHALRAAPAAERAPWDALVARILDPDGAAPTVPAVAAIVGGPERPAVAVPDVAAVLAGIGVDRPEVTAR